MDKVLDLAEIKIHLTGNQKLIAKVTLSWDEFEIRYCRITRHPDGSPWFQPPALVEFGWKKCFYVKNVDDWHRLEGRVIKKLFECLEKESAYSKEFIAELKKSKNEEEINIDEIPDSFT